MGDWHYDHKTLTRHRAGHIHMSPMCKALDEMCKIRMSSRLRDPGCKKDFPSCLSYWWIPGCDMQWIQIELLSLSLFSSHTPSLFLGGGGLTDLQPLQHTFPGKIIGRQSENMRSKMTKIIDTKMSGECKCMLTDHHIILWVSTHG